MTQAQREGRVLCAGRLYCDLIFTGLTGLPEAGKEQFASGLSLHAGGGAYITAAYLDSLQRPASLFASMPSEPFLSVVKSDIQLTGIDASLCHTPEIPCDPQLTVAMALLEDRAFLTRRAGPALPEEGLLDVCWPDLVHLHVGELRTLIEHPELIAWARNQNLSISLDPSWDDVALTSVESISLINAVDVFLPNQAEYDLLQGAGYVAASTPVCVVKKAGKGACLIGDGNCIEVNAKNVEVVDTTGAGDAFNAGFLDAWLSNLALVDCVRAGNDCGAEAVGRIGSTM